MELRLSSRQLYDDTNRLAYFDNVKGMLIALVVLGHYAYAYAESSNFLHYLVSLIYTFHMPAFIFVTGYLSKSPRSRGRDALLKLGAAYLVFNFALMLLDFLLNGTALNLVTPYFVFWYILAVIVWRLIAERASRLRFSLVIFVAATLLVGLFASVTNILAIGRTVAFFPFFLAGFMLKREYIDGFLRRRRWTAQVIGGLIFVAAMVGAFFFVHLWHVPMSQLLMQAYHSYHDVLGRVVILALATAATIGLLLATPKTRLPLITTWGRNSLSVYLMHRFPMVVMAFVFPASLYGGGVWFKLALGLATVVTLLLLGNDWVSRYLDRLLAAGARVLAGVRSDEARDRAWAVVFRVVGFLLIAATLVIAALNFIMTHKAG